MDQENEVQLPKTEIKEIEKDLKNSGIHPLSKQFLHIRGASQVFEKL